MNITASARAVDELKKAIGERRERDGTDTVRVMVRSRCGCGKAHFAMGFDRPQESDSRLDLGGVTVLVDPDSAPFLENAEMDYSDDLMGKGFRILIPGAGGGCGCGGGQGHHH